MVEKGLIVGRFQPLHKGHLSVFKKMAEECDCIIIGIGSAQLQWERDNPLSGGERITMIKRVLDNQDLRPYKIYPVPDIDCYPAWPHYVKTILPDFDYLYAHSETVLRLFKGTRTKIRKVPEFNKREWSATKIRNKIAKGEEWKHLVPNEVAKYLEEINVKERLKPMVEMRPETEEKVAHLLTKNKLRIATAESCTGGLIANRFTNVPGSSSYFDRGMITYSNDAKMELLGVEQEALEKEGAVSRKVARQMSEGIRKKSGVDLGLATTGIMGPGGGSENKPIGTVYAGLAYENGTEIEHFQFSGNRREIKNQTSEKALRFVIDFLEDRY